MKILNARKVGTSVGGAIYVGRPSKFGNPFDIRHSSRDEVCDKFEAYFLSNKELQQACIDELSDKDLICWCYPKRCHAETYVRFLNGIKFGF